MLDGAILVLCAVGGVQSQSITVDRQMKRYHVPRLAFINKMDRTGANPSSVVEQVARSSAADAVLMQMPIGKEENFEGVIDLITHEGRSTSTATNGEKVRDEAIPAELKPKPQEARQHMLEALSMFSDELMELLLDEEDVPVELIHKIVREAVHRAGLHAGVLGTAYKNKGVQPLLDAIVRYLPSPLDREIIAKKYDDPDEKIAARPPIRAKPFVGMAFKIVEDPFGQLTFIARSIRARSRRARCYFNQRTGQKQRFSRIVKMHADQSEDIDSAEAGDIVAVMGLDCASGDTYAAEPKYCRSKASSSPSR